MMNPMTGEWTEPFSMTVTHDDDGILHADMEGIPPNPDGSPFWMTVVDFWLLPGGAEGWFIPGESWEPGELRETWEGYFLEFEVADGPSPGFILRDPADRPFMRGTRSGG